MIFLYAETQNHRLIIHTSSGDTATRISFFELMSLLPEGQTFLHERTRAAYQFFTGCLGGRGRFCPSEKRQLLFLQPPEEKETKEAFATYLFDTLRKGGTL